MPGVDVIDISHWQEQVDFTQVEEAGVIGVILKCTEGTTYLDKTYNERIDAALKAELMVSAYHFLKHGNIAKQMQWFAEQAGLPAGSRLVIDYEDGTCTLADLEEAIAELGAIDSSMQICVYCGGLLKDQVRQGKPYPWLSATSLWLAHYTNKPSWPTWIWPTYSLWQYTDKGKIAGVSGDCDLNVFNGSADACAAWFGPVVPELAPEREMIIRLDFAAPPDVRVRVIVNDEEV